MSPLEPLAPDQRAVVALVLQQGRSYDEIAALLGIPVEAVRGRAQAGLAALAPGNGLPDAVTGPLADYLLRQQPAGDAEATRGLLAESAPARAWASEVAARLAPVAPAPLPEVPDGVGAAVADAGAEPETGGPAVADPDADVEPDAANRPPPPRPRPLRDAAPPAGAGGPPASSRIGGIVLIVAVLAVVGVVLFLVLRGGGDDAGDEQAATPTATATATATPAAAAPQLADEIPLRPAAGGDARGTMTVYLQDGQLLFALQAENVPPSSETSSYAVWLTGPGKRARRLGFTSPVGEDGRLGIQGPGQKDLDRFDKLFATYANVIVSEERSEDAERPSKVVLAGKLPAGR